MKKTLMIACLGLVVTALAAGCGGDTQKSVVRITDNEGVLEPREITVQYVNDRIDRMPPHLVPDVPGEEGKRQFIDEIIRKELLVIKGMRMGLDQDPQLEQMRQFYTEDKARQMYLEEMVYDQAEPTQEEVEEYNVLRETAVRLLQIAVRDEEAAWEAHRRVTEGGEDFGELAKEISVANSAADGGELPSRLLPDQHPVVAMHIMDLEEGEITEPIEVGGAWHIYKLVNKKEPPTPPELDEQRFAGIKAETRVWKRTVNEYEFNEMLEEEANLQYSEPALAVAGRRIQDALDEIIPEGVEEMDVEARMEIARLQAIPEFAEDEQDMELVTYEVGDERKTWTLADFQSLLEETPGIESPKTSDPYGIKLFLWRKIRDEVMDYEVARRGYANSQELKDYVDMRAEEYIVNVTYAREVNDKVEEPSGQEIRDYFRSHRDDYVEPAKVDLKQLIVPTEAEANALRQRLVDGDATFEELVEAHSIEMWSKGRGGLVEDYYQGERRLEYLQDVVFDMEPGELSEPFPGPGGYALVELIAKYPSRQQEFSELGDRVKQDILLQRKEERLAELLEEVRATVEIEWFEDGLADVKDTAQALGEKRANRVSVRQ